MSSRARAVEQPGVGVRVLPSARVKVPKLVNPATSPLPGREQLNLRGESAPRLWRPTAQIVGAGPALGRRRGAPDLAPAMLQRAQARLYREPKRGVILTAIRAPTLTASRGGGSKT